MLKLTTVMLLFFSYAAQNSVASMANVAIKTPAICFTNVPGSELVQKLLDPSASLSAYYELWRRNREGEEAYSYSKFLDYNYNPRVILCPQPEGEPPLYLVLANVYPPSNLQEDEEYGEMDYTLEKPDELFQVNPKKYLGDRGEKFGFDVFQSNGKQVEDLHGYIEQPGMLGDINNDGILEHVSHTNYGSTNRSYGEVLEIVAIKTKPQPLLAIWYNTDTSNHEWTYRCVDEDKDGVFDIVLGPLVEGQVKTKAVFSWNKATKAYVGPEGKEGDHFRRIDPCNHWSELEKLALENVTFPKDADAVKSERTEDRKASRRGKIISYDQLSKPYQKVLLAEMSDDAMIRYMGYGKSRWDFEQELSIKTQLSTNFWTMEAKAAALEIVEANRYEDHKKYYRLAIDDRDGRKPPEVCTLAFSYISDRSYHSQDSHFFIRADPKGSYLAFSDLSDGGIALYHSDADTEFFDLRYCEMTYQKARQFVHAIWWLNRVRSYRDDVMPSIGYGGTTADGSGCLVLRDGDGHLLSKIERTIHVVHCVADFWDHTYNKRVLMNLAASMIYNGLLAELGEGWSGNKDKVVDDIFTSVTNSAAYKAEHDAKTRLLAGKFLNLFSTNQTHLSIAVANVSAVAAGSLLCTNLSERLAALQEGIIPDTTKKRTSEEVESELEAVEEALRKDDENIVLKKQCDALEKELRVINRETGVEDVNALKEAIAFAQKKIRFAEDFQALQEWATSQTPGSQWALKRLKAKDKKRYVAALEWLANNTKDRWAQQALEAAVTVEPISSEKSLFISGIETASQLTKYASEMFRPQLESVFFSIVKKGRSDWRFDFESLMMEAWSLDLRELKHVFEGLATSCPEDYEFDWTNQNHPDVPPFPQRSHLARQIVALWEDNDSFTQCRLLIAFALSENYRKVADTESVYLESFVKNLERSYSLLTAEEKDKIDVFCEYCKKQGLPERTKSNFRRENKEAYVKVYGRIRKVLNK
jgi:hypothetical protein